MFGISLAESAALAESLPESSIDDPACELDGLPTFVWTGAPIVLDRTGARCEDGDIVNLGRGSASWLFALEFPDTPTPVDVSLTVPPGVDPIAKGVDMVWCDGELGFREPTPLYGASVADGGPTGTLSWPWHLRGRYVGHLSGPMQADGSAELPRVVFEQPQP